MKTKFLTAILGLFIMTSCANRVHIVDLGVVSMKSKNVPKKAKKQELGPVTAKYCPDSFASSSGKTIGLIDSVVEMAEKQKKADFLTEVSLYRNGSCIELEGTANKLGGKRRRNS